MEFLEDGRDPRFYRAAMVAGAITTSVLAGAGFEHLSSGIPGPDGYMVAVLAAALVSLPGCFHPAAQQIGGNEQ